MSAIFEQLRISDDGRRMYINVHVNRASYFDNVYLDSISIVVAKDVSETNPTQPSSSLIYYEEFEPEQKEADLVLTANDFNEHWGTGQSLSGTLFFVYVKCEGTPDPCTPCRLDEEYTLGVTFDEKLLYQRVMDFTKQFTQDCQVPVGFVDFILLWNAFKASVETEHYIPAIKYWSMLFEQGRAVSYNKTKPCGCHG